VSSVHLRWGLVQLAFLSCTLPFHAQSVSVEGQAPAATFKAETHAVNIDVVVLDSRGEPVKDLRKEDFAITEDGTPQTAAFFEEHTSETAQSNTASNMSATNVLLIDTLNTPKQDSIYVRERVGSFLKSMPQGTSLAVFSLGQTLRMVQGLTADRAMLLAAVENNKTGVWSETNAASNMPLDDVDDQLRAQQTAIMNPMAGRADMIGKAQAMHKNYQNDQRIAMTIAALQRLARYLAKTPGRKNLIWFSSAFPAAVFPDPNPRASLMTTDHGQQIRETTNLLALARVAIYPVQGQGIAAQTTGDASDFFGPQQRPGSGVPTGGTPPSDTYQQSSNGDNYSYAALSKELSKEDKAHGENDAAMHALASDTGGQVLPASNDLSAVLARAIRDGSQYYTLNYTPTNRKTDGSFRRIEVKLRTGNDRLAYRRGYYATDAMLGPPSGTSASVAKSPAPVGDPLTPLMRSGMAPSQQISYEVHVQPAAQQPAADAARAGSNARLTGPVTRYRVDFRIHREVLQQEADGRPDKMQVEAIVYDASGKALNWVAGNMDLDTAKDAAAQQSGASMRNIRTQIEIDVPKEAASIVTGVYDWRTGSAGTQPMSFSSLAQTNTMQPGFPAPAQGQSPPPASKNPADHTPALLQRPPATVPQTH
jgi:VWFA-related protein